MINVEIGGTLPKFQTARALMEKMSLLLAKDTESDVSRGGNPAWPITIFGRPARFGYIRKTMQTAFGDDYAEVSWGGGLIYAKVQERGMNIIKTPAMRRAMWARLRDQGVKWDGRISGRLNVPARSATQGIFARKEKYVKYLHEQISITESVPVFKGMAT